MTLLSVIRDVCAVVGVQQPASVTTNLVANRTMQEMLELANEMAQRIAYDTRDWTLFRKTVTFTGDAVWTGVPASSLPADQVWVGGTTAFNLPVDYRRMLLTSNVWRADYVLAPMVFIPDTDEWLNRRARNWNDHPQGEWTMYGGQMQIFPAMVGVKPAIPPTTPAVPANTAYFTYMEKNCINLASGGVGDSFVADGDRFRLDERLLKLGMTWQWKQNKGTSYAEDMGTYSDALSIAMGHDGPAPIIIGRRPMGGGIRTAYPFPVPT